MSAPVSVFCSSCGVENRVDARFCSACGSAIAAVEAPKPLAQEPPQQAAAPAIVREAIVATGLQRAAIVVVAICGGVAAIVTFLGFGVSGMEWGTRPSGFLTEVARPAPGYVLGAFLILILNPLLVRRVGPRRRDVGMPAVRGYRKTLRERDGIRMLLAPSGLRTGVVILSLLWIGIGAIALYNLGNVADQGFDVATGLTISTVVPIVGLVATVCLWPFASQVVYMDRQGVITRG